MTLATVVTLDGKVRTGHYLEEDDIVRYEDIDARV